LNRMRPSKEEMIRKFKVRKIHVYLTLVLLVLGFLISYSIHFTFNNFGELAALRDSDWERLVKLNEQVLNEREKNAQLQERLQNVRAQVAAKEKELSQNDNLDSGVIDELDQMRMQAGLISVTGPGVIVTLDDSKNVGNNYEGIVHDRYIRDVVNELCAAGAEGIAINDERLISTSTVRCVGPTVLVNDTKIAAPFVIKAIGNPNTLYSAMLMPGGVVDILKKQDIKINVKKEEKIDLPGFVSNKNYMVQR